MLATNELKMPLHSQELIYRQVIQLQPAVLSILGETLIIKFNPTKPKVIAFTRFFHRILQMACTKISMEFK